MTFHDYQNRITEKVNQINILANDPVNQAVLGQQLNDNATPIACIKNNLLKAYDNYEQINKLHDEMDEIAREYCSVQHSR